MVRMLEILEDERICAMGLIGVTSIDHVTPHYVCKAAPVTVPHEMRAWVNKPVERIMEGRMMLGEPRMSAWGPHGAAS